MQWFVYLLRCADGSVYAGITTDVKRRVLEHNTDDVLGARYTRGRRPVQLAYVEGVGSRADAAKRERALKRMRRTAKLALIERGIPGTSLYTQLAQFQATRQSLGLVVDEYGELLGLVTVEDILEEIVGEFTAERPGGLVPSIREADGSCLVEGAASVRELNRRLGMDLPVEGSRTLNGLLLEKLEAMPEPGVSVMVAGYPVEIVQVQDRMVKTARIGPRRAPG